jgi:EAL domain-containing protein (putative c-di-GMP-specific phosphodiesterase class I)
MTQKFISEQPLQCVEAILSSGKLRAHFQPIVRLKDGKVVAHESLIRMPANSALTSPDEFFAAARAEGLVVRAEQVCLEAGLRAWSARHPTVLELKRIRDHRAR